MNRRDFLRTGAVVAAAGVGQVAILPRTGLTAQEAESVGSVPAGILRLNFNENALGLTPAARQSVADALAEVNRYPDAAREQLAEALAKKLGVGLENIVLGTGSTDILQMIVQAAAAPDATLVMADPTFEVILRYQRPLSYTVVKAPLDRHFAHDIQQMREKVDGRHPAVVYLCNPNNPTATLTPSAEIDAWIAGAPETVLFAVDEAYFEYVRAPGYWSAIKWIADRPNVVVTRTFSKIYGMAGMRIGYAIAHPDTADRLREFMSSDNVTGLAAAAALASIEDPDLVPRRRAANDKAKRITQRCLDELELAYLPSHTNFLMHRIPGDLDTYRRRMREHGVYVGRRFPPLLSHNRLSLGRPEEMERFSEVLRYFRKQGWV